MPVESPAPPTDLRWFNMELLHDEFLSDVSGNSGRYPKGAILRVDEPTALRWYERGIAMVAPPDAPTYSEVQKMEKTKRFHEIAKPVEGVFDQVVGRAAAPGGQSTTRLSGQDAPRDTTAMPAPMPVPRRGRPPKLNLEGADIMDTSDEAE